MWCPKHGNVEATTAGCPKCGYLEGQSEEWCGIPVSEDVTCPFCGKSGFDLIGLKMHLTGEGSMLAGPCEAFTKIEVSR